MEKLLFGVSGLPMGDGRQKFNLASGIEYVKEVGLDAMEVLFVRSVTVTDKNVDLVNKAKEKTGLYLSAHGSYYVNLNAAEEELRQKSLDRIREGARALASIGGRSLVFHPGFYLDQTSADTYANIRRCLASLPAGEVTYRLETTGKPTQFGSVEEIVSLCRELPHCRPCIDFAHVHARGNGCLKGYDDFAGILQYIKNELGAEALLDMHIHLADISYTPKGERCHLSMGEGDFPYVECLKALKDFGVRGCVIAEGPRLEHDALMIKKAYEAL